MQQDEKQLNEKDVAVFLKQHPDFFRKFPELAEQLDVPHETGGAVSLVEFQSKRLRDKNNELHERLQQLVENARRNDRLFEQTRRLTLDLLDAQSIEEVEQSLQQSMSAVYGVDHACITLFVPAMSMQTVIEVDMQHQLLQHFGRRQAICGQLSDDQMELFFHSGSKVGSLAACLLKNDLGIIALGHRNEDYFKSNMDTLFLDYVAEIVSRRLDILL
ncbi:DUF484 family protein [Bermanella sp. R86510]|uniref:DUF484 family protein n=1 Tax=unclassified Bermanella TaxID=2627862 RepID=UPI0037CC3634